MRSRDDLLILRSAGFAQQADPAEAARGRLAALALTALDRHDALDRLRASQALPDPGIDAAQSMASAEARAWDLAIDEHDRALVADVTADPPSGP